MKVAEFVAEILLKGGGNALQDVRKISAGIKDLRLGLGAALKDFYQISAAAREMAVSLDMYQLNTGLSGEQLQKLSFQASQAGVSMTELGGVIQKLQQMNANARLGYGWDPVLSRFGLRPGQDPVAQLNQIGSALRRLQATNPAEAHALAMKAGLSDSMYYALLRGSTEQMDKQLVLTQKEQSALVKLNQQWNKFWFYLKQIAAKLQVLSAGLQTRFVKVLLNASKGFLELVTRARELIKANEKLKFAVIALGLALTAYFQPWLLVLGAVALALEDIWVYFQGGDSITGEIVNWCKQSEEFKKQWEGITALFEGVVQLIKWIIQGIRFIREEGDKLYEKYPALNKINEIAEWVDRKNPFAHPIGATAESLADFKKIAYKFGEWTHPVNAQNITQTNNNSFYIQGSDANEIVNGVVDAQKQINQAQQQQAVRSLGGNGGGTKYNRKGGAQPALAID